MAGRRAGLRAFEAKIEKQGIMYVVSVPVALSRELRKGGTFRGDRIPVAGRVQGVAPFQGTLVPRGGGLHRLMLNGEVRAAAGVGEGDRVRVELRVDAEPREIPIPEDLAYALREEGVLETFQGFAPGRRYHILRWVEAAVHETTRDKRVARVVEVSLAEKEKHQGP
jgi:hypothetical protein